MNALKSRTVWKTVGIVILILIVGYKISQTEIVQGKVNPEKYWSKQISIIERAIRLDEDMIYSLSIELKKKQLTWKLDMLQEMKDAEFAGKGESESAAFAADKIQTNFDALLETMKVFETRMASNSKKLENAKQELLRVRQVE